METIGTILILLSFLGILFGAIGVLKGSIKFLKIRNRKNSLKMIGFAFIVMFIGAMFLPTVEQDLVEQAPPVIDSTEIQEEIDSPDTEVEEEEPKENESSTKPVDESNEENKADDPSTPVTSPVITPSVPTPSNGTLAVHFIDVGQGAAQVIVTPNNKVMVIDGGNNSEEKTMVNYLNSLGIKKVDILIGTHPDADHVGGLDAVVDHFDIGQVIMPKVQRDTQTFQSLLNSIAAKGLKVTTAKAGLNVSLDPSVTVQMISPVEESSDANEMSAVVKVSYGNHSFLLVGDAGVEIEKTWIQNGVNLQSTVLLVGHHGSDGSTSEAFVNKVKPTYAVIQVGKNSYGHPTNTILNRLTKNNVNIYRTDTDGTIVFKTDGSKMTINKNAWINPNTAIEDKKPTTESPTTNQNTSQVVPVVPAPETSKPTAIQATAAISNSTPTQNSTVTVTVKVTDTNNKAVANANVKLKLAYKSTTTEYEGTTDVNGNATLTFKIGRAAKGFTVNGDIIITANGLTTSTSTAFTPQ